MRSQARKHEEALARAEKAAAGAAAAREAHLFAAARRQDAARRRSEERAITCAVLQAWARLAVERRHTQALESAVREAIDRQRAELEHDLQDSAPHTKPADAPHAGISRGFAADELSRVPASVVAAAKARVRQVLEALAVERERAWKARALAAWRCASADARYAGATTA